MSLWKDSISEFRESNRRINEDFSETEKFIAQLEWDRIKKGLRLEKNKITRDRVKNPQSIWIRKRAFNK